MAISKIKKIELIGLKKDKEALLTFLQKLGVVELINVQTQDISISLPSATYKSDLLEIEEAISYLASFRQTPGLLEGMVKLKPLVYQQQLKEVVDNFDYTSLLKQSSQLRKKQKILVQQKEKLSQESQLIKPWENLGIPLDQIYPTQYCGILLGALPSRYYEDLLEDFKKEYINLFLEVVYQDKTNIYLVILYIKEEFECLGKFLKNYHFNFITLGHYKGKVKERILEINRESLELDRQLQGVKEKIADLAKQQFKLMVVYDYLANIKKRYDADKNLIKQQYTFSLSGWIRKRDVRLIEKTLSSKFKDIAIFISEPRPDEDIPTALENRPVIQPFEAVTNLYGLPLYSGLDPSGFLAPFFAISFGFCLLDAGYGLILLMIMLFYFRKKQISAAGKNFLRLFLFMSIATIFAGFITGNFFGDLISRLPAQFNFLKILQKRLILFDPVKDSLIFLGFTLSVGFIQIWTGVFIRFLKDLRRDKFAAFILDLPTLMVQTNLLMLILVVAKVLPNFMLSYAGALFILSAILVIYYQWKSNREMSLKIFWSIFGIYSIVTGNFLADTLSFCRIFALGLTGGLLGMAINTMLFPKGGAGGIFTFIGILFSVLILFIAHITNLAIGMLGAYVHTSRLQYLEFFTKFFDSGGRPFRPFKEETKYIFLEQTK